MSSPWHFDNTTATNPLRRREGLKVLKDLSLNDNILGKPQEELSCKETIKPGNDIIIIN
jgi:hypothetical protein